MVRRVGWIGIAATCLACLVLLWPRTPSEPRDRLLTVPLPNTADELRIVVLGTSLTARYDWPAQLQRALSTCLGRPIRVGVVARPGASIAWGAQQAATVSDQDPDLVLIEFAINDADLRDGVGRRRARELTADLLSALKTGPMAPQVVLMTMSPAQGLRGWKRPGLARRYADYRALAAAADVGLIDLHARWLERPRAERGLAGDGLHPDAEIAATLIVPAVAGYIGQAAGRHCDAHVPQ